MCDLNKYLFNCGLILWYDWEREDMLYVCGFCVNWVVVKLSGYFLFNCIVYEELFFRIWYIFYFDCVCVNFGCLIIKMSVSRSVIWCVDKKVWFVIINMNILKWLLFESSEVMRCDEIV